MVCSDGVTRTENEFNDLDVEKLAVAVDFAYRCLVDAAKMLEQSKVASSPEIEQIALLLREAQSHLIKGEIPSTKDSTGKAMLMQVEMRNYRYSDESIRRVMDLILCGVDPNEALISECARVNKYIVVD
jgi:hypothetical protein